MKRLSLTLALLVILLVVVSCTTRYGALTVATTKNIDINMAEFEKVGDAVTGKNTKPIIIIIPTGTPSIEDAIDDALAKGGGDIMQNVVIYYKWFYIPYIYGEYSFVVKGDVWKLKSKSSGMLDHEQINNASKVYQATFNGEKVTLNEIKVDEETIKNMFK